MAKAVRNRSFTKAPAQPPKPTAGAVLGYGRVSREGQDLAQQRAAGFFGLKARSDASNPRLHPASTG
jgi:hypothetical protein